MKAQYIVQLLQCSCCRLTLYSRVSVMRVFGWVQYSVILASIPAWTMARIADLNRLPNVCAVRPSQAKCSVCGRLAYSGCQIHNAILGLHAEFQPDGIEVPHYYHCWLEVISA